MCSGWLNAGARSALGAVPLHMAALLVENGTYGGMEGGQGLDELLDSWARSPSSRALRPEEGETALQGWQGRWAPLVAAARCRRERDSKVCAPSARGGGAPGAP